MAFLADKGFDRRYGARPLQRTIEALVVTPLARYLVNHPTVSGRPVMLDVDAAGNVTFEPG